MAYKKLIKVSNVCQLLDKSKYPATQTIYGVTFTNNGDGSITVNGTATNEIYHAIKLFGDSLYLSHKYLLTGETSGLYLFVENRNENNGILAQLVHNNIRSLPSGTKKSTCVCYIKNGVVCDNLVLKPQLFDLTEMYGAGHEPATVEEFRQDFPDEMYDYSPHCWLTSYKRVIVTGDGNYLTTYKRNLTCKTKNLFDINSVSNIKNWVTSTTAAHPYGYYTFYLKPNTTYTFSRKYASNNDKVYACFSKNYGVGVEDGMFIHPTASSLVKDKLSFTTDDTGIMYLNVYGIRSVMNSFIELIEGAQLELGDTATDYVPYGHL